MKTWRCVLGVLLLGAGLSAQGLLHNPELAANSRGEIMHWLSDAGVATPFPGQGPDGRNAVKLTFAKGEVFKQPAITLVAGETYRVSAYIKTADFTFRRCGMVVWNYGWQNDAGISPLPNPCPEWTLVQADVTLPQSSTGTYTFGWYALDGGGELLVSSPTLEPLTEKARAGAKPAPLFEDSKRLIPVAPRLFQIPVERPELTFSLIADLPPAEHEIRAQIQPPGADAFQPLGVFPLVDGDIKIPLGAISTGQGRIKVELVKKADGAVLSSHEYPFGVIVPTPAPASNKKLNQLVTEVINAELENKTYEFVNPRPGWVYIALTPSSPTGEAFLDDQPSPVVKPRVGEASETMRHLEAGTHQLRVTGTTGGRLHVRLVPELHLYPFFMVEKTDQTLYRWDLDFYKKHFFPAVNFINGTSPSKQALQEVRDRGIRLIASTGFSAKGWRDASLIKERIAQVLSSPGNDGVTLDELFANGDKAIHKAYSEAMWDLLDEEKLIYTWVCSGYFKDRRAHQEMFAAASNVSRSRGKVLNETYIMTQPTLEDMETYLDNYRNYVIDGARLIDNPAASMMMIMTGLISCGRWNCYVHPEVDIKYFFDRFYHMLANAPEFDGLYGLGCYNSAHIDEETMRWVARLMRHYAVEGRRDLLSDQYGFRYLPGHLQDGDFVEGFTHWQSRPAAEGTLQATTIKNYGGKIQMRRSKYASRGDHVAIFQRHSSQANQLSQTATGLQPGKLYTLSYVVGDFDDIAEIKPEAPDILLTATLEGAEVIPSGTYVHRWPNTYRPKAKLASQDTHRILFRAQQERVVITFRDWQAEGVPGGPEGQRLVLNFVSLKPYYEQ
ncbi:MAG: hypothetical protein GX937_05805 [Lentisphaerae bacterium]|jgi:hypothetical protein|nr:hypothetical protein [Lentisphaerota bacterium]